MSTATAAVCSSESQSFYCLASIRQNAHRISFKKCHGTPGKEVTNHEISACSFHSKLLCKTKKYQAENVWQRGKVAKQEGRDQLDTSGQTAAWNECRCATTRYIMPNSYHIYQNLIILCVCAKDV